jgi:hypothetical protein
MRERFACLFDAPDPEPVDLACKQFLEVVDHREQLLR